MKKQDSLITLLLIVISDLLIGCAIPQEESEEKPQAEDDIGCTLHWEGETEKFIINAQEGIRLNDLESGSTTAFITTLLESVRSTRWETDLSLKFNPSVNNYVRLYLASSSTDLFDTLDGYFLQIGGSKDDIALYRQEEDEKILIIPGRELMKGNSSPNLRIKIECDPNGQWTLWTKVDHEKTFTMEGSVRDTNLNHSVCCGICCVHTATRSRSFSFRQFRISHDVEISPNSHEEDDDDKDKDGGDEGDHDEDEENPEEPGPSYPPSVPGKVKNMLLFNEIMYDSAPDGAEYIEFYNPSDSTIIISKLLLFKMKSDGKVFSTTILQNEKNLSKPLVIAGKSYICFTKDVRSLIKKHQASPNTLIEISKFPLLSNEGGYLALVNADKKLIDKCRFFDWMHNQKVTKGISLEKESPEQTVDRAKWHSSKATSGGTPGVRNSLK